jgi:hypothetical protein
LTRRFGFHFADRLPEHKALAGAINVAAFALIASWR